MAPTAPPSLSVSVATTVPICPPNAARKQIVTSRLVLRPVGQPDLSPLHRLRSQPEVMRWTKLGIVDNSLEATQQKLDPFLPPNDLTTYNFAICLRRQDREGHETTQERSGENLVLRDDDYDDEHDVSGEFIGIGGCYQWGLGPGENTLLGWPGLGYMIRKEHWGKGYGSEFMEGFLSAWRELPRQEIVRTVDESSVFPVSDDCKAADKDDDDVQVGSTTAQIKAKEQLCALTEHTNFVSVRLLQKNGFTKAKEWKDKNHHPGGTDDVTLVAWLWDSSAPPYQET
ncbi:hypothetical protein MKZ38_008213 [Zalerion maritima]|uniref:N-acetyltransferase domain-containing protein n=1 Tax=Zalerion maritima TaxID=339359 RepID=A0AAD5RHS1_9PEZI|nr:hypothetical protein MKZ38_008213 [Zalerion maritima]